MNRRAQIVGFLTCVALMITGSVYVGLHYRLSTSGFVVGQIGVLLLVGALLVAWFATDLVTWARAAAPVLVLAIFAIVAANMQMTVSDTKAEQDAIASKYTTWVTIGDDCSIFGTNDAGVTAKASDGTCNVTFRLDRNSFKAVPSHGVSLGNLNASASSDFRQETLTLPLGGQLDLFLFDSSRGRTYPQPEFADWTRSPSMTGITSRYIATS